jgi:hypothetical protein
MEKENTENYVHGEYCYLNMGGIWCSCRTLKEQVEEFLNRVRQEKQSNESANT